ncbi:MAG: M56 family metallopeptidase [Acidobacteriaceae bacterium]
MMNVVVEAALRSLLMGAMVWAGLRLLRIGHVMVQKMAFGLVLVAALAMPFLMHWHMVESRLAIVVPIYRLAQATHASSPIAAPPAMHAPLTTGAPPATEVRPVTEARPASDVAETEVPGLEVPSTLTLAPLRGHFVRESSWRPMRPMAVVATIYFVVGGFLLLRLLCGLAVAFRLWHRAEPASSRLALRDAVRVSSTISTPVTVGSGILLPQCYGEWEGAKLRMVLAHERAHVRQGDFYLQLFASLYTAAFWFSPLGWLLLRKLSELGEAISDRAALEEAATRTGYAELLLEFAAMPRRSYAGAAPVAGVAMARSSNIQHRIDRLLNERRFRLAFMGGKRHVAFAAALIPCALLAATSLVRVQAAEAVKTAQSAVAQAAASETPAAKPSAIATPVVRVSPVVSVTPVIKLAPVHLAPVHVAPVVNAKPSVKVIPVLHAVTVTPVVKVTRPVIVIPSVSSMASVHAIPFWTAGAFVAQAEAPNSAKGRRFYTIRSGDGDHDSYAVVSGGSSSISGSGDFGADFAKVRSKVHGDYIWFKHDGKSYIIDDPALVAQAKQLFKPMEELGRQQGELGKQQERLGAEQGRLGAMQAHASIPTPDISKALADAEAAMKQLQLEKKPLLSEKDITAMQESIRELQAQPSISMPDMSKAMAEAAAAMKNLELDKRQFMSDEDLSEIQGKIGDLQGSFGDLQSQIGEKQSALGEQQSALGEQQSKLGEQQSTLGEQQSKLAEENSQKMKTMFNDALRNGKAKPVE